MSHGNNDHAASADCTTLRDFKVFTIYRYIRHHSDCKHAVMQWVQL